MRKIFFVVFLACMCIVPLIISGCGVNDSSSNSNSENNDNSKGNPGDECSKRSDCISGICVENICKECFENSDCADGKCEDFKCVSSQCEPSCEGVCCGDDNCGGECPDICGDTNQQCNVDTCECEGDCEPKNCTALNKDCGEWDDKCGATIDCGSCQNGLICNENGKCAEENCEKDCSGRECGLDPLCGETCGSCDENNNCNSFGKCICIPDCNNRECGLDPFCGESCGSCDNNANCNSTGKCECVPNCSDRECGDDPICGENCGNCGMGERCNTGGSCESVCTAGLSYCNNECVDTSSDPNHCGRCNNSCDSGNGICANSQCKEVINCREEACPDDYYCDLATGECEFGCAMDSQCDSHEHCDLLKHECICDSGYHACGGTCLSNASVDSCDDKCEPCPTDPNGVAQCINSSYCKITCNNNYHLCNDECKSRTSTDTCGYSCAACPQPSNSTSTCDGVDCGFECNTGYHKCGDKCLADSSINSCGTLCSPCEDVENATETCDGTNCNFICDSALHKCGDGCVENSSIEHCGDLCAPCLDPENGEPTCNGLECGIKCDDGYHQCGDKCLADNSILSCGDSCDPCPDSPVNAHNECINGTCEVSCNNGTTKCDEECVNLMFNNDHCSSCNNNCIDNKNCLKGECISKCTNHTFVDGPVTEGGIEYDVELATGHFNNDDNLDVVVANSKYADEPCKVYVYYGDGAGGFESPRTQIDLPDICTTVTTADVNGDNLDDILVGISNEINLGHIALLLSTDDGFNEVSYISGPIDSGSYRSYEYGQIIGFFDLNSDAKPDLFVGFRTKLYSTSYTRYRVMLGNGDGTFTDLESIYLNAADDDHCSNYGCYYERTVMANDFNFDGKMDVAFGWNSFKGGYVILYGNNDGTFTEYEYEKVYNGSSNLISGDFNEDGRQDFVMFNHGLSSVYTCHEGIEVLLADSVDGSYSAPQCYNIGPHTYGGAVADFDKDGNLDIAASSVSSDKIGVRYGNGRGTFDYIKKYTQDNIGRLISDDLNNDGYPDLIMTAGSNEPLKVFVNSCD